MRDPARDGIAGPEADQLARAVNDAGNGPEWLRAEAARVAGRLDDWFRPGADRRHRSTGILIGSAATIIKALIDTIDYPEAPRRHRKDHGPT